MYMRPHVISKYSLSFCKRKGDDDSERCFYFHDLQSFIDGNAQEYIWEPLTDEEFYKCYKIILEYLKEHNVEMYQDLESDNGIYSFCLQEECEAMSDGSPIHVRSFEDARTEVTALADELFHDNKDDYDYNDTSCFMENTIRDAEWLIDDVSKSKLFIEGFFKRYRDYFVHGGESRYNRYVLWSKEFVSQNQKRYLDIMNKDRRKDIQSIINSLNTVLSMTKKKEAVNVLEIALRDIELVKDEEQMAKDSLPDNFFLTEQYDKMESNVNDLYDAIGDLENVIEDVTSLNRLSINLIKEPINKIINNLQTVVER